MVNAALILFISLFSISAHADLGDIEQELSNALIDVISIGGAVLTVYIALRAIRWLRQTLELEGYIPLSDHPDQFEEYKD